MLARSKIWIILAVGMLFISASSAFAKDETVKLVDVLESGRKVVVQKKDRSEIWLLDLGGGSSAFIRHKDKDVKISSPGAFFAGIGAEIWLPDNSRKIRIWRAEKVASGVSALAYPYSSSRTQLPKPSTARQPVRTYIITPNQAPAARYYPEVRYSDIDLYDSTGRLAGTLSPAKSNTIYAPSGKPVAYLEGSCVYGFNGNHLGWYKNSVMYDTKGKAVAAVASAIPGGVKVGPAKGPKLPSPPKLPKQVKIVMPVLINIWSEKPAAQLLQEGRL